MADINLTRTVRVYLNSSNDTLWKLHEVLEEMLSESEVFSLYKGDFSTYQNAYIGIQRKLPADSQEWTNYDFNSAFFISAVDDDEIRYAIEETVPATASSLPWDDNPYYSWTPATLSRGQLIKIKFIEHGESAMLVFEHGTKTTPTSWSDYDSVSGGNINDSFSGKYPCVIFMSGPATPCNTVVYGDRNKIYPYVFIRKTPMTDNSQYLYQISPTLIDPDDMSTICSTSTDSKWFNTYRDVTQGGLYPTFDPYICAGITNARKLGNYKAGYLFNDFVHLDTITVNAYTADDVLIGDDRYDYVYAYGIKKA